MSTKVMRTKTVRKQKPVYGEKDETAVLRKEEMRNSEGENRRERKPGKRKEGKAR